MAAFFAGCIKDPDLPDPPVKGKWLLSKIYDKSYADINDTTVRPTELLHEYLYRKGENQPWVHISYDPPRYPTESRDTFFYDQQHRLSEVSSRDTRGDQRLFKKRIRYRPDGRVDTIEMRDRYLADNSWNSYRSVYTYQGNVVTQIIVGTKNPKITIEYHYDSGGNIIARRKGPGAFGVMDYSHYDNSPNIMSFLNMNIYLPCLSIKRVDVHYWEPENVYEPFISKNNYGVIEYPDWADASGDPSLKQAFSYEYKRDKNGLITEMTERSPTQFGPQRFIYKYIPAP